MKRHEWTFQRSAIQLKEAAQKKADHHQERLEWWSKKREEVRQTIGERGIEIHDPVASGYSNKSAMYGPEIRVDDALQRDITECHTKAKEHDTKRHEYTGWVQVFDLNPSATLELNHDDFLFFFGE